MDSDSGPSGTINPYSLTKWKHIVCPLLNSIEPRCVASLDIRDFSALTRLGKADGPVFVQVEGASRDHEKAFMSADAVLIQEANVSNINEVSDVLIKALNSFSGMAIIHDWNANNYLRVSGDIDITAKRLGAKAVKAPSRDIQFLNMFGGFLIISPAGGFSAPSYGVLQYLSSPRAIESILGDLLKLNDDMEEELHALRDNVRYVEIQLVKADFDIIKADRRIRQLEAKIASKRQT